MTSKGHLLELAVLVEALLPEVEELAEDVEQHRATNHISQVFHALLLLAKPALHRSFHLPGIQPFLHRPNSGSRRVDQLVVVLTMVPGVQCLPEHAFCVIRKVIVRLSALIVDPMARQKIGNGLLALVPLSGVPT